MVRLACIAFASSQTVQTVQRLGSGAPTVAQRALILAFIGTVLNHHRLDAHIDQFAFWDLVGENWALQMTPGVMRALAPFLHITQQYDSATE